jgi:glycogen(starch) synthase
LLKDVNARLRILYAIGPGDTVDAYRFWKAGTEAPFEMSVAFSKTFLDWCERTSTEAHLISSNPRREFLRDGRYVVENRPKPAWYWGNGAKHHLGLIAYGLSVIGTARRERPDIVIADSGTTHWIVLSLLALMRIPVIAVMHSTLWPTGYRPQRLLDRLLLALDGVFFRRFAAATVCVSPECERQVRVVAGSASSPFFQCRAQFRRGFLDTLPPPPFQLQKPFRVLYVGRIEESKGIFFILSIAQKLEEEMPGRLVWKIVGHGGASAELARQIEARNLGRVIDFAGKLCSDEVLEAYGWAHATIVPTTSRYREGMAMTAIEAILAGRPVVISDVVPAGEVLGDAAIRARTEDVDSFVAVFRKLVTDPSYYDLHRAAPAKVCDQFYDTSQGLGDVLGRAISSLLPNRVDGVGLANPISTSPK